MAAQREVARNAHATPQLALRGADRTEGVTLEVDDEYPVLLTKGEDGTDQ